MKKNLTPNSSARDRCRYGSKCYRKNPLHFQQFSHPADPDWDFEVYHGKKERNCSFSLRPTKAISYKESDSDDNGSDKSPQGKKTKVSKTAVVQDNEELGWGIQATGLSKVDEDAAYVPEVESTDDDEEDDCDEPEIDECHEGIAESSEQNPMCRFGTACYRNNPKHFKEFRHPDINRNLAEKRHKQSKKWQKVNQLTCAKQERQQKTGGVPVEGVKKQKHAIGGETSVQVGRESHPESWAVAPLSLANIISQPTKQSRKRVLPPFVSGKSKKRLVADEQAPNVISIEEAPPVVHEIPRVCDSPPLLQSKPSREIISRTSLLLDIPCFLRGIECYLYLLPAETAKTISRFCRVYDGDIASKVTQATTHIICSGWNIELQGLKQKAPFAVCVSPGWILECISHKRLVSEKPYFIFKSPEEIPKLGSRPAMNKLL